MKDQKWIRFIRIALCCLGAVCLILAWVGWKFDYNLPLLSAKSYVAIGVSPFVILVAGRVIGPLVVLLSALPILVAIVRLIVQKDATWASVEGSLMLLYSATGVVAGFLSYALGTDVGASWTMRLWHGASESTSSDSSSSPAPTGSTKRQESLPPLACTVHGENIRVVYAETGLPYRNLSVGGMNAGRVMSASTSGEKVIVLCERGTVIFDVKTMCHRMISS